MKSLTEADVNKAVWRKITKTKCTDILENALEYDVVWYLLKKSAKEDKMRVHYVWADMNNPVTRNTKRGISPADYTLIMLIIVNVVQMAYNQGVCCFFLIL